MALTIKSFIDLMKSLPDANRCREFMEQHKWNGVPTCPHCNHQSDDTINCGSVVYSLDYTNAGIVNGDST